MVNGQSEGNPVVLVDEAPVEKGRSYGVEGGFVDVGELFRVLVVTIVRILVYWGALSWLSVAYCDRSQPNFACDMIAAVPAKGVGGCC